MKIVHVVSGLNETGNGMAVAARRIAIGQRKDGHDVKLVDAKDLHASTLTHFFNFKTSLAEGEVWVHGMWLPNEWWACWRTLKLKKSNVRLVRMPHGCLDPIRLKYHGWKKRLAAPIERWLFARTDRVVVTGAWEADWCHRWGLTNELQNLDLKRYFKLEERRDAGRDARSKDEPLHVLYLGRRHPLKGVSYLERAIEELNGEDPAIRIELRIVSDHSADELERDWTWCDVLCLPTLSENFGLVVAEALERGKHVITTDGAPAWEPVSEAETGMIDYLKGYRTGNDDHRIDLIKKAFRPYFTEVKRAF